MLRLRTLLISLRSSLWFLPSVIVVGAGTLALIFIELDSQLSLELLTSFPRLFGAGADGSRGVLTSIAGSMITVASVTFSIMIVALSQASSQYSSRVLRNFMRDRANQVVLGVFLGVFTYCLFVLRAIRGGDEGEFIPSLSVFGALILALVAISFLIFFIHHAASSLQASNVIAAAAHETFATIDRLFPERLTENGPSSELSPENVEWLEQESQIIISAPKTGYIQNHDEKAFFRLACSTKSVFRMHAGIGEFTAFDSPLVSVYSRSSPNEELVKKIQATYSISALRTIEQDAGFGVRQIVDIALKALSSGVNDTTTAITCIDYLTAINLRLANRRIADPMVFEDGRLRVIAKGPSFEKFIGESFDEIRVNARGNATVIMHLVHSFKAIGAATDDTGRQLLLRSYLTLLEDLAGRTIDSDYDAARISRALE